MRTITKQQAMELYGIDIDKIESDVVHFRKADDDPPFQQGLRNIFAKYFDGDSDIDAGTHASGTPRPNDSNDVSVLPEKLEGMVAAIITAAPSVKREQAVHFLLHTARGRSVATHFAGITKKEQPMVDIYKLHNPESVLTIAKSILAGESPGVNFHEVLMGHAALTKAAGQTTLQRFNSLYESTPEYWKAYKSAQEAGWVAAAKGTMSLEPVSVGVGSTATPDDSMKAVQQLKELAAQQHKTFEAVMLENPELTARTYTSAHRPNLSSTSGSELQR